MNTNSAARAADCAAAGVAAQNISATTRYARLNAIPGSPFLALGGCARFLGRTHAEYYCSQYLFFRGDLAFLERDICFEQCVERKIDGLPTPSFRRAGPDRRRRTPRSF